MKSKIILVEDSPFDAYIAMLAMKQTHPLHQIIHFHCGPELFGYLEGIIETDVQMILLDMNMPGMNGLDVLEKLKTDPRYTSIPVVMVTGSKYLKDISDAYKRGASNYLMKPVSKQTLSELVDQHELLDKSTPAVGFQLSAAPYGLANENLQMQGYQ